MLRISRMVKYLQNLRTYRGIKKAMMIIISNSWLVKHKSKWKPKVRSFFLFFAFFFSNGEPNMKRMRRSRQTRKRGITQPLTCEDRTPSPSRPPKQRRNVYNRSDRGDTARVGPPVTSKSKSKDPDKFQGPNFGIRSSAEPGSAIYLGRLEGDIWWQRSKGGEMGVGAWDGRDEEGKSRWWWGRGDWDPEDAETSLKSRN